jgi:3-dehydrosphinganine reductase
MDTPGFVVENKTKPAETREIEAGESLYTADETARCVIDSYRKGEYHIACGDFGVNMLVRATAGMTPRNNCLADMLLLPLLVLVGKVYTWNWDKIVCDAKYDTIRQPCVDKQDYNKLKGSEV